MIWAFSNFRAFLHMGGYAVSVWSAYAIVLTVLCLQLMITKYKFYRLRKVLYQKYVKSS